MRTEQGIGTPAACMCKAMPSTTTTSRPTGIRRNSGTKTSASLACGELECEELIKLYAKTGAKYFVAIANHHDNFDCWDSKYQPWNCVNVG